MIRQTFLNFHWGFKPSVCSLMFLVVWAHGLYVVCIRKKSTAHALGGVNGVAYFIYADEQVQ